MKDRQALSTISAARRIASTLGGLGGLLHGVGETLQGNVVPDGIIINSWTQGPIATKMGGDPGMTIVPHLLITGILTIIVSLTLIVWSIAFVQRKHGGLILFLLSIIMLLVGGGFGPPILGFLAGVGGLGINAPYTWWRTHLHVKVRRFLAQLWPWVFGVCVINGVFLVLGHAIFAYLLAQDYSGVFVNSFFFAVLSLLISIFTGLHMISRSVSEVLLSKRLSERSLV